MKFHLEIIGFFTLNVQLSKPRWRECSTLVQKLMPGPASHLFLSSISKTTRKAIVAKAEEVGEQVRRKAMFTFLCDTRV